MKLKQLTFSLLISCMLLFLPLSGYAQTPLPLAPEPADESPSQEIPIDSIPDSVLEDRLKRTLANIDKFKKIHVSVANGVVTLAGEVLTAVDKQNAVDLVSRFEGVIYAQNKVVREIGFEERLAPATKKIAGYGNYLIRHLPVIITALIVVILSWYVSGLVSRLEWPYKRLLNKELLRRFIKQVVRTILFLIGLYIALDILDIAFFVGALIGTAGVLGLAVGFAFRDIVENYLAGMLLSLRSPFAVNDRVLIGSDEGKVVRVTTREMVLRTLDGNHLRIPNATVFKSVIYNYTRNPQRRFEFFVKVDPKEDLVQVREVGCSTLLETRGVLSDPEPLMRVEELGASSVTVRFLAWMDQRESDWFKVKSKAIRRVKEALDESGIELPTETFSIRLHGPGAKERMEAAPTPSTASEEKDRDENVSVDRQLDEQVQEELATSEEENLLSDEKRPPT